MIQVISPHIDDAVLSLGGFIESLRQENKQVKVIYVFSISDWTNSASVSGQHYERDPLLVTDLRKNEEALVAAMLKHEYLFLDYKDHPLRANNGKTENDHLMSQILIHLQEKISKEFPCFFPAGHGHPDHVIIRDIGFSFLEKDYDVRFYEDQPYASCGMYNYQKMHETLKHKGLNPILRPYHAQSKMEALRLYSSQVSKEWIKDILNYSYNLESNKFYERYWMPRNSLKKILRYVRA